MVEDNSIGEEIDTTSPETAVLSLITVVKRIFCEALFPLHWNVQYSEDEFLTFLMHAARHKGSIYDTYFGSSFERETSPSSDTVLYHLHNLDIETVDKLYRRANENFLEFAQKNGLFRSSHVQLVVDFLTKAYYGEEDNQWVWKKELGSNRVHVYRWMTVSFVDKDQKYVICVRPVPVSVSIGEILTSTLTYVYDLCKICDSVIFLDGEFENAESIRALQDFCKPRNSYWLAPVQDIPTARLMGKDVHDFAMQNEKGDVSFIVAMAHNGKGGLHPFATNLCVKTEDEFYDNDSEKLTSTGKGDLFFGALLPDDLYNIYRGWQIEPAIKRLKHPFLIATSSAYMPARDYLVRFAALYCFAWMVFNALLLREFGPSYWLTDHAFERLLYCGIPHRLEYCFTKAPKNVEAFPVHREPEK